MKYESKLSRQDSVIRSMAAEGASYAQIACATGATVPGVRSYCMRIGIAKEAARSGTRNPARGPRTPEMAARNEKMAAMFKQGVTLQKIGEQFGVTRELVRQVLKRMGLDGKTNGGAAVRRQILGSAAQKLAELKAERKAAREKRWGVSDELLAALRSEGITAKYRNHKTSAKARGIPFSLTLGQWWAIWQASGHAHERGRGLTGYCMSRICDSGGYVLGNVHIQPSAENSREAVKQWKGKAPKVNKGVFLLYPGLSTPYLAKVGKVSLGLFPTEQEAAQARIDYIARQQSAEVA